jgi:hypothetical protein
MASNREFFSSTNNGGRRTVVGQVLLNGVGLTELAIGL